MGSKTDSRRLVDKLWSYGNVLDDLTAALAEFEAVAAAPEYAVGQEMP